MNALSSAVNAMWWLANGPEHWRYRAALREPGATQRRLLMGYLRRNADTEYGRRWGFADIRSPEEYQARVPLTDHDDYAARVDRIAGGEQEILTRQSVTLLQPSSGSTAAAKLIPYTAELRAEFGRAIAPWVCDLFGRDRSLIRGSAYWSITPATSRRRRTTRIPVGFKEDSAYLGGGLKRLVDATLAVPADVCRIRDMDAFRYITLRFLLARRDLRLVSIWHPSFLSLLLDALPQRWDALLGDVRAGELTPPGVAPPAVRARLASRVRPRRRRAAELAATGPDDVRRIWPHLSLVSCWADGHAALGLPDLQRRLPGVAIQPKGLIATEGIVTVPYAGAHPLAVRSHFFEFLTDDGEARLAHQLEQGGVYRVVLTTGGGLYRYQLHDRVKVTGFLKRTPSLRFVGREDHVSDLCGEKLSEGFVASVVGRVLSGVNPSFAMLAPDRGGYTLFIAAQSVPPTVPVELEAALQENPHYRYCVELGQLRPARVFVAGDDAAARYLERCRRLGRRLGDIKPVALSTRGDWADVFSGRLLSQPQADHVFKSEITRARPRALC